MKKSKNWLKTNLVYGFVVIVPLAVLVMLIAKLVEVLEKIAVNLNLESTLGAGAAADGGGVSLLLL